MLNVVKGSVENLKPSTITETSLLEASLNISSDLKDKILSVSGFVTNQQVSCEDNFVNYSGNAIFNVLFMGEEVERIETGVKFNFKKQVDGVMRAFLQLSLDDFKVREENGQMVVGCELTKKLTVFTANTVDVVDGLDGLTKKQTIKVPKVLFTSGTLDLDDNFQVSKIKKVLLNSASVGVLSTKVDENVVTVCGEATISFVLLPFLENSDIVKEVRVLPFSYELECLGADQNFLANALACVNNLTVKVYESEEENKSVIESLLSIDLSCFVYGLQDHVCVLDAISRDYELDFNRENIEIEGFFGQKSFQERVVGRAAVTIPEYSRFIKAVGEYAVIDEVRSEQNELFIKGVIFSDCIFYDDNGLTSTRAQLPFSFSYDVLGKVNFISVVVKNLQGKLRSGRLEQDANLIVTFSEFETSNSLLVTDILEGDEKPKNHAPISVYMGKCGDDEWAITKLVGEDAQTILQYNKDLEFPLKKDEKILVFRKK